LSKKYDAATDNHLVRKNATYLEAFCAGWNGAQKAYGKSEWKGLTKRQIKTLISKAGDDFGFTEQDLVDLIRAVEAKLREKNA